jgi:hypothetical protein
MAFRGGCRYPAEGAYRFLSSRVRAAQWVRETPAAQGTVTCRALWLAGRFLGRAKILVSWVVQVLALPPASAQGLHDHGFRTARRLRRERRQARSTLLEPKNHKQDSN